VLVHDHNHRKWDAIIREIVKQGVWFLHVTWAFECLDKGVRLPELCYHLPGGAPILLGAEDSPSDDLPKSIASGQNMARMSAVEIEQALKAESALLLAGGTVVDMIDRLVSKVGEYLSWS